MSVLSAAKSAAIRLNQTQPASLFTTTQTFDLEIADLATEAAVAISKYYDWQALKFLQSHVGDGATVAFDLSADYSRMLKDGEIHSLMWPGRTFRKAKDENEWIYLKSVTGAAIPGVWIILGGKMQIFPPLVVGDTAQYYFISNKIVAPATGANKAGFTADTDNFVLPERLLTLALIWRWRAFKRTEYAEDMANYETALAEETSTDKGSRVIVVGRRSHSRLLGEMPYPGMIPNA